MHHAFKLGDTEYPLELSRAASGYRLHLADRTVPVELRSGADGRSWLTVDGVHSEVVIATRGDDVFVHYQGEAWQLRYGHPLARLAQAGLGAAEDSIRAPMPGSIVSLQCRAGDAVTRGQVLLVMESMKMETTIVAPRDGTVGAVHFEPGQTFDRDALLLELT